MNNFLRIQGNDVIVDKNQLIMYGAAAIAVMLLVAIVLIASKTRKKNFIKTIPTNLKDVR
jgi:hypothetical protein